MKRRIEHLLVLALAALIALSGCTPRPAPAPEPSTATATLAAADLPGEGGITTDEPPVAPRDATELPAATLELATAAPTVPPPNATQTLPPTIEPPTATPEPPTATVEPPTATLEPLTATPEPTAFPSRDPYPLQIEVMRQQSYPGSAITIEQTLPPGSNYSRYVISYLSEGNKIYALMTVPDGPKPATGWPAIVFNHGYIPPQQYRTTERYVAYVDAIARSGYIVFKSDYRGHGKSDGEPVGAYGFPDYTADVLNALTSVKAYKDADPVRIGRWGHSMGGSLTLRAMVVSKDIKAGVIWGGVVGPYPNIFQRGPNWRPRPRPTPRFTPTPIPPGGIGPYGRAWQRELTLKYGTVQQNPAFWASISPNSYLADISGPIQLDHSVTDEEVPVEASQTLYKEMQDAGKTVELYTYPGDNHNISKNFNTAMQRTVAFFDRYVKGS
ncbi:MAG: alpha/beta hydrolase family protein [Nitrososphaerales archaeon]